MSILVFHDSGAVLSTHVYETLAKAIFVLTGPTDFGKAST